MLNKQLNFDESAALEVSIIERNQQLKPKAIRKQTTVGDFTDIIKVIGSPPDLTSSSREDPSQPSIITFDSSAVEFISEDPTESSSSSSIQSGGNVLQLRKEISIASRAIQKEDIFVEIELSDDETIHIVPPPVDIVKDESTCSDVSLRVTTGGTSSLNEKRNMRLTDSPFLMFWKKHSSSADEPWAKSKATPKQLIEYEASIVNEIISTFKSTWKESRDSPGGGVSEEEVRELFRFGSVETAFNSFSIDIKELTVVPDVITEGRYPELEERAALYMQILFDEMAFWKIERSMAFGTLDPRAYKRPKSQPLPSWTMSGLVDESLTTGEYLYQALIDSESKMLEKYILWMVENPSSYRPAYIVNSGYFHKVVTKYAACEEDIRKKLKTMRSVSSTAEKYLKKLRHNRQLSHQ